MSRLLVITPVRNEAEHLERVAASVVAQHRRPDRWILVDDGSDDATPQIAAALAAAHDWIEAWYAPQRDDAVADRLAVAAEARALLWALGRVGDDWTLLGKLDGDMVLDPAHFALLDAAFAEDERLGIAGSYFDEERRGRRVTAPMPAYHVNGALKVYRRACWEAIGGIEPRLGWDTIDETRARMLGWRTHSRSEARPVHLRPSGAAGGQLRGRARHGECVWIVAYPPELVLARAVRLALTARPRFLGGAAFLFGFVRAAVVRQGRPPDRALLRFSRAEQRARVRAALRLGAVLRR